jgi:hypothetical protein
MSAIVEKYGTLSNVLRPSCRVEYITPSEQPTGMPVNCAISNTEEWLWKYYEVITNNTLGIGTTSTYKQCDPTGEPQNDPVGIELLSSGGLTETISLEDPAIRLYLPTDHGYARAMFGYIATHPIFFQVYISVKCDYGRTYSVPSQPIVPVIGPQVRLFKQDGTLVTLTDSGISEQTYPLTASYVRNYTMEEPQPPHGREEDRLYVYENILPATPCPLFLHFGCYGFGDFGAAQGQYDPAYMTIEIGFKAQPYIPPE